MPPHYSPELHYTYTGLLIVPETCHAHSPQGLCPYVPLVWNALSLGIVWPASEAFPSHVI